MPNLAPAENVAGTTLESPQIRGVLRRAVIFPCLVVLLLCGLLGWQIRLLIRDYGWVTHTERVLGEINLAQRLIIDHETALRAHLIAGEPEFLEPYRAAERDLPAALDRLEREAADNAAQMGRLAVLRRLYSEWTGVADTSVGADALCEPPRRAAVLADMRARKATMDEMRGVVAAMVAEEQGLMRAREGQVARADRFVKISGAGLGLLLAGLLVVVFRSWLVRIDRSYRKLLDQRTASEEAERQARTAAEALAEEIKSESHALEQRFTALRAEVEELRRRG